MNEERMLQILLAPQMSEKAVRLSAESQYVFKVANDATKPEIRTAVEKLFSVEVKSVRVLNVRADAHGQVAVGEELVAEARAEAEAGGALAVLRSDVGHAAHGAQVHAVHDEDVRAEHACHERRVDVDLVAEPELCVQREHVVDAAAEPQAAVDRDLVLGGFDVCLADAEADAAAVKQALAITPGIERVRGRGREHEGGSDSRRRGAGRERA